MDAINILNVQVDNVSLNELLEHLDQGVVYTPNVDHLIKLQSDREFQEAYQAAHFRVCDSKVLYYVSRFLGAPLREKISGSDLFPAFYEYHRHNPDIRIFLLGAREGVARTAQQRINAKIGRDIIVDAHSPSFGFEKNEAECDAIVDLINESGATVLAVGVGAPKQEKWIHKYKDRLPNVRIFLAIGATIDFEAGSLSRAPQWMSAAGLEWLYRLAMEPHRLWRRYLLEDPLFFWLVLKQKLNLYIAPNR
ncbi:WecB/TagA/CpsF family glycosyltransferase [Geitlerinema sp. PCC 7407]|uniref:WecB/TagA/CpsF family glycosyltransferase n=1 Tax=Geitlerinema sp. PCC 7407 TaxID=1173025 RepID=UPI00029F9447|nr:WecB/TagA/CpsF family glycosyltransferase [Geitlerinema sp. PCC 7407]AFY65225.1 glycosyl transferase, WecB/TagA/CpsF family [Geitlerinema sp. PCC 7407]